MIHFSLVCGAGHGFEAWFRNTGDFDVQANAGHVTCPTCGGTDVRKALMAPNVTTARNKAEPPASTPQATTPQADAPSQPAASLSGPVDAPTVDAPTLAAADPRQSEVADVLRALRVAVIKNTENVGKGFAEEARKMHYGEAAKRGIHGETSAREAHELREEGIEIMPLPSLPEDSN